MPLNSLWGVIQGIFFLPRGNSRILPALLFLSVKKFVWFKFTYSESYLPEVVRLCTSEIDFLKYTRVPYNRMEPLKQKFKTSLGTWILYEIRKFFLVIYFLLSVCVCLWFFATLYFLREPWGLINKSLSRENSLMVQWLGLCASTAGGLGLIPGQGTKRPQKKRVSGRGHSWSDGEYSWSLLWFSITILMNLSELEELLEASFHATVKRIYSFLPDAHHVKHLP